MLIFRLGFARCTVKLRLCPPTKIFRENWGQIGRALDGVVSLDPFKQISCFGVIDSIPLICLLCVLMLFSLCCCCLRIAAKSNFFQVKPVPVFACSMPPIFEILRIWMAIIGWMPFSLSPGVTSSFLSSSGAKKVAPWGHEPISGLESKLAVCSLACLKRVGHLRISVSEGLESGRHSIKFPEGCDNLISAYLLYRSKFCPSICYKSAGSFIWDILPITLRCGKINLDDLALDPWTQQDRSTMIYIVQG